MIVSDCHLPVQGEEQLPLSRFVYLNARDRSGVLPRIYLALAAHHPRFSPSLAFIVRVKGLQCAQKHYSPPYNMFICLYFPWLSGKVNCIPFYSHIIIFFCRRDRLKPKHKY